MVIEAYEKLMDSQTHLPSDNFLKHGSIIKLQRKNKKKYGDVLWCFQPQSICLNGPKCYKYDRNYVTK